MGVYRFAAVASLAVAAGHLAAQDAFAQSQFKRTNAPGEGLINDRAPVLLSAPQMDYDQDHAVVTATGGVEVTQGDTVLLAEELVYDQKRNTVTARGNVSMMEPSGNVVFADEALLTDDMSAGIIRQFKARLSDNSLFVAARAKKIDEETVELDKAVYSPCKVKCAADGDTHAPMWQLHADHVRIDGREQLVTYDNAGLDVYGVPVFYTPYLSHATPGADNKSGILTPEFQQNGNLGSVFKAPFYYVIGQDKDVTLTPIYTTQEGLVMAGEYRQRFNSGELVTEGSITRVQDRNNLGYIDRGQEIRGHWMARGKFAANESVDWGFNVTRTTDDTYLRRYNFSQETLLTSRLYAEAYDFIGPSDRTYANVQALSFQGLTAADNSDRIPLAAPLAEFTYETDPGLYNSRFELGANTMLLYRDLGTESRRLSVTGAWKLPYITSDGQIIEFKTSLRADTYSVDDVTLPGGQNFGGVTGRVIPEAELTWRYPFLNQISSEHSVMLEPIVALAVSPLGGNPEKIPNEDSLVPEFTDTNLFSANRFAGYDRVETGPRVSYGLRGHAQLFSDKYIDWLFGQHYRVETDRNFPFSNDLTDHFSDYVGKLGIAYLPIDLAYRFRLDREDLAPKRNELDASVNYYPVTLSATYLSLSNDPVLATKEELTGTATLNLTKEWQWMITSRRDLELDQITSVNTGLTFKNECTYMTGVLGKEYTRDRDVKPTTTFLFRIALKNLE